MAFPDTKQATNFRRGQFFNRMKWATLAVVLIGVVGGIPLPQPMTPNPPFVRDGDNPPDFPIVDHGHPLQPRDIHNRRVVADLPRRHSVLDDSNPWPVWPGSGKSPHLERRSVSTTDVEAANDALIGRGDVPAHHPSRPNKPFAGDEKRMGKLRPIPFNPKHDPPCIGDGCPPVHPHSTLERRTTSIDTMDVSESHPDLNAAPPSAAKSDTKPKLERRDAVGGPTHDSFNPEAPPSTPPRGSVKDSKCIGGDPFSVYCPGKPPRSESKLAVESASKTELERRDAIGSGYHLPIPEMPSFSPGSNDGFKAEKLTSPGRDDHDVWYDNPPCVDTDPFKPCGSRNSPGFVSKLAVAPKPGQQQQPPSKDFFMNINVQF